MDIHNLFEARAHANINARYRAKDVVKNFEPYFGRQDAFVSMVEVPKIGINPTTGHDSTPAAIYAYPLSEPEIINQFPDKLPYMGFAKYAALIIAKPNLKILSSEMSEVNTREYRQKLDVIMNNVIDPLMWEDVKKQVHIDLRIDSAASCLFQETNVAASILSLRLRLTKDDAEVHGSELRDGLKYFSNAYDAKGLYQSKFRQDKNRPLLWNSLLRKLGFDAISDYGTKFIFSMEPFQTGFLYKGAIETVDIFSNGKSDIHGHKKTIESATHLFRLIREKKISTRDALILMGFILDREVIPSTSSPYSSYSKDIRLGLGQIRTTIEWLKKENPKQFSAAKNMTTRRMREIIAEIEIEQNSRRRAAAGY